MCYTSQSWVSLWRKKPDRSRSDNLLPDYMATLQVQQRNVPPVITYMNIWIASKCTANGGWLNPTTALDLVGPDTKVQAKPGKQLVLRVGSFTQVTHRTSRSAQGRVTALRIYRTCELVLRHAAKLEDINVIAARCCVSMMYCSDENHQSSWKTIKTLLNN